MAPANGHGTAPVLPASNGHGTASAQSGPVPHNTAGPGLARPGLARPGLARPGSTIKVPLNLKAAKAALQNKPRQPQQQATQAATAETEPPSGSRAFSLQQLTGFWQAFFVQLKANNGSPIELMLAASALEIKENYEVQVLLSSSLQEEPFERLKPRLQSYLRQQLHNAQLSLIPRVAEESGPRRLYTNSEKLQYLLQRYPLLGELKERLGLEADF